MSEVSSYQEGFRRALALTKCRPLHPKYSEEFQEALRGYFGDAKTHPRFQHWWSDHMGERVNHAMRVFCPWLIRDVPLEGKDVLEVGCGTGSSTVAVAAHARSVLACEIYEKAMDAARIRVREDGWADKVSFMLVDENLEDISKLDSRFDVFILYAVLEHMVPEERRRVIDIAWRLLRPGGAIVVYETPNRWSAVDTHTTGLAAWSWLPPELALKYGQMRRKFPKPYTVKQMYREGYGLSYREIKELIGDRAHEMLVDYKPEGWREKAVVGLCKLVTRKPGWAFMDWFAFKVRKV
jgi:2-polyprenyl-3-methyl-5-hydroxy-6-metoxy-1,4-benzoquinol methylase